MLKRFRNEAGIDLGDETDYLVPRGTRRGAGEVLVRTSGHAAAARALGNFKEVIHDHYSGIEADELPPR